MSILSTIWKYRGPILTGMGLATCTVAGYMGGMQHSRAVEAYNSYKTSKKIIDEAFEAGKTLTGEDYSDKKEYKKDKLNNLGAFVGNMARIEAKPAAVLACGVTMGVGGISAAVSNIHTIDVQAAALTAKDAIIAEQTSKLKAASNVANLAGTGLMAGSTLKKPDSDFKAITVDENGEVKEIEGDVDSLFDDTDRLRMDIDMNGTTQLSAETGHGDAYQSKTFIRRAQYAVQDIVNKGNKYTLNQLFQEYFGMNETNYPELKTITPILMNFGWEPGDFVDFGAFSFYIQTENGLSVVTDEEDLISDNYELILRRTDDGYVRFAFNAHFIGDASGEPVPSFITTVEDAVEV